MLSITDNSVAVVSCVHSMERHMHPLSIGQRQGRPGVKQDAHDEASPAPEGGISQNLQLQACSQSSNTKQR